MKKSKHNKAILFCKNFFFNFTDTTTRIKHTTFTTGKVSPITILFLNGFRDFSIDNNKSTDTTVTYITSEFNLFENNLVHVIIGLIGAFVFFFAIFVFTYIYFKCFRKTTNSDGGVKENEWQAQYKSLRFESVEPQIPLHPEPQGRVNTDCTYLTPVFSHNENQESRRTGETEPFSNTYLQDQRVCSQESTSKQDETNITEDDVQEHVYIEITEENTESSI